MLNSRSLLISGFLFLTLLSRPSVAAIEIDAWGNVIGEPLYKQEEITGPLSKQYHFSNLSSAKESIQPLLESVFQRLQAEQGTAFEAAWSEMWLRVVEDPMNETLRVMVKDFKRFPDAAVSSDLGVATVLVPVQRVSGTTALETVGHFEVSILITPAKGLELGVVQGTQIQVLRLIKFDPRK